MHTRLFYVLSVTAMLAVAVAVPAAAGETSILAFTEAEEGESPAEEDGEMVSEGGVVPAVEAPPADEDGDDQPWTFRYMVPTVMAMGVLGLIGAGLYYAFRIRGRYQVVE